MPKEAVMRRNPLVPWPIARAVWASLKALKAGNKWPTVLARAAPTTPARGADEGGTKAPPRGVETPALQDGEEVRELSCLVLTLGSQGPSSPTGTSL